MARLYKRGGMGEVNLEEMSLEFDVDELSAAMALSLQISEFQVEDPTKTVGVQTDPYIPQVQRATRIENEALKRRVEELEEDIEGLKAGRRNVFLFIPCVFIAIALMLAIASWYYPTNLPAIGGPPAFAGLVPVESPAITQICDGKVCKKY